MAAHFPLIPASIGGKGEPERVWGQSVSGNFFPSRGRADDAGPVRSSPEDDQAGGHNHVAVLSNNLWRRRFGGDANILNHEIASTGASTQWWDCAAGVLWSRSRHRIANSGCRWRSRKRSCLTWRRTGASRHKRDNQWVMLNARLKPGVSRSQPQSLVNVIKKRLDDTYRKDEKVTRR